MRFILQMSSCKACIHTFCITYLVPCHIKQAIPRNCADITILKTCIHPNASQEHRNTRGAQHNGAFKNTSAFFWQFLPGSETFLTIWIIPLPPQNQSKWKKLFSMSSPDWFSAVHADGTTMNHQLVLCVHRLLSPPASDLLQMWSKVTFYYYCSSKCSFSRNSHWSMFYISSWYASENPTSLLCRVY